MRLRLNELEVTREKKKEELEKITKKKQYKDIKDGNKYLKEFRKSMKSKNKELHVQYDMVKEHLEKHRQSYLEFYRTKPIDEPKGIIKK